MRKTIGIIGALVFVLVVALRFGLIAGLLGAMAASYCLKRYGIVSADSAWVSETKGMKIAKYIVLGVVIVTLACFAYIVFIQK